MTMKKDSQVEKILKPYNEEIKRHMTALSEDFQGKVKVIGEQFGGLNEKIDKINETLDSHTEMIEEMSSDMKDVKTTLVSHTEMIGKLAVDVEVVKTNVEFMKGSLKKKVDYDEFLALERRLSLVESKIK